jgi:hypothetical protein
MSLDLLINIVAQMKGRGVNNYVLPGLSSHLLEHGRMRVFTSSRDTEEHITPHSHRFDFACLVLRGSVENAIYRPDKVGDLYVASELQPRNGGMGTYQYAVLDTCRYRKERVVYGAGEIYAMGAEQIHSIKFSSDAIVLFFEGPTTRSSSVILEPSVDGKRIPTFQVSSWMFEEAGA